jgi:hypothetical protein
MSSLVRNARRRAGKTQTAAEQMAAEREQIVELQAEVARLQEQTARLTAEAEEAEEEVRQHRLRDLEPIFAAKGKPLKFGNAYAPEVKALLDMSTEGYRLALQLASGRAITVRPSLAERITTKARQ